jgi:hypothetical protein
VFAVEQTSFLAGRVSSGVTTLFRFLGAICGSFLALWVGSFLVTSHLAVVSRERVTKKNRSNSGFVAKKEGKGVADGVFIGMVKCCSVKSGPC